MVNLLRKAIVALVLFTLLMIPVAGASSPIAKTNDYQVKPSDLYFNSFPQIYINASKNTSFNVSFLALMLVASTGIYMSYFPSESWGIQRVSQNELIYQSNISLKPLASEDYSYMENQFNISNLGNINNTYLKKFADGNQETEYSTNKISAIVQIIIQKTNFTNPSYTNNSGRISGFDITFKFIPKSQIPGIGSFTQGFLPSQNSRSGDLFLFQVLGARIQNDMEGFKSLTNPSRVLSTNHASGDSVLADRFVKGRRAKQAKIREAIAELIHEGIVESRVDHGNQILFLRDPAAIKAILNRFRESFLDSLTSNVLSLLD